MLSDPLNKKLQVLFTPSVPMRGLGFEKAKEYLHVPENYEAMLMLPVGKAIKAGYLHARYELEDFFQIVR